MLGTITDVGSGLDVYEDRFNGLISGIATTLGSPNNWSCVEGECIPGGCTDNGDCKDLMGEPWICATISGVGHCVVFCDDDLDCVAENMPHATCEDIENYSFCVQPQP